MISVIICTYNRSHMLVNTLESVKALLIPPELVWELILVDNNSSDDTKQCVERFSQSSGLNVRYVFEAKQGLSHARNAGIREAVGDIIAFTDDDVTVDPGWLLQLRKVFDEHKCMGVAGKIVPVWTGVKPSWYCDEGPYRLMGFITQFDLGGECREIKKPPFGANMIFRKEAFQKYGHFRTDLGRAGKGLLHGEDTEFGERLISGGETFVYAPEAVVYHPVEKERTKKRYCQRWYFMFGRTAIRRSGISADTACYFGIPRYLFRSFLTALFKWAFSVKNQARFHHKLLLCRIAGEIAEAHKIEATE